MTADVTAIIQGDSAKLLAEFDRAQASARKTGRMVEQAGRDMARVERDRQREMERSRQVMERLHANEDRLQQNRLREANKTYRLIAVAGVAAMGLLGTAFGTYARQSDAAKASADRLGDTWKRTMGSLGSIIHQSGVVEILADVAGGIGDVMRWTERLWGLTGGDADRNRSAQRSAIEREQALRVEREQQEIRRRQATGDQVGALRLQHEHELKREHDRLRQEGFSEAQAQEVLEEIRGRQRAEMLKLRPERPIRRAEPAASGASEHDRLRLQMQQRIEFGQLQGNDAEVRAAQFRLRQMDLVEDLRGRGFNEAQISQAQRMLSLQFDVETQNKQRAEREEAQKIRSETLERWRIEDRMGEIQKMRAKDLHAEAEAARIVLEYEQRIAAVRSAEGVGEDEKARRIARLRSDLDMEVEAAQLPSRASLGGGRFLRGGMGLDSGTIRQVFSLPRPERDEREQLKRLVDTAVQIRDRIDSGVAAVAG